MNCNTCRYELSQCLDGRLPSGRRAVVLEHAESCESCNRFWEELQAAQSLTLSLKPTEVSSSFREGLWERIHAGEGTPDAVFHEPVAVWTKVRYALTGAAAAAALLIGVTFLQKEEPAEPTTNDVASTNSLQPRTPEPASLASDSRIHGLQPHSGGQQNNPTLANASAFGSNPLLSNAQPLTMQVLAHEAASQLEQRFHEAAIGMRMMRDPDSNRAAAVRRVIHNANELRDFGELLIELRERKRLFISDDNVDRDLSFAVEWLDRVPDLPEHSPDVVETYYGPALSRRRLANVTDHLTLRIANDPQREQLELKELNTIRPEVFPKLFFVIGDMAEVQGGITTILPNMSIVESACGPSLVAPRSRVIRHDSLLRMFGQQGQVTVEIEVREGR